jgi:hypothetical protein
MQDFEDKIQPWVTKKVDPNNPAIVTYQVTPVRRRMIDIRNTKLQVIQETPPNCTKERGVQGVTRQIWTPFGIFKDTSQAAAYYNITPAAVTYRCTHWTEHNFFYYTGGK